MEDQNGSTQTQDTPTAPPAGQSVEEVKAQLKAEFDKTREGLIRDLQQERAKRQELEQRLQPPAPSPANQDVTQDELGKVLTPYNAPIKHTADEALRIAKAMQAEAEENRAKGVLITRTGKKWEEIEADKALQTKLDNVVKKYKLLGTGPLSDVMNRAYDIVELEDSKSVLAERERSVKAASNASMPSGAPPAPVVSGKVYSAEEFNKMHWKEFDKLSSEGGFKKQADGSFKYSPK